MVNSIKNFYFYSLFKICYHLERAFKICYHLERVFINISQLALILSYCEDTKHFISSNNFNEKMQYNDTV